MTRVSENELRYLAGLFDGEGTFSIQIDLRTSSTGRANVEARPRMSMTLKHGSEVLNALVDAFGGKVYGPDSRGLRRWALGAHLKELEAARALEPYLRIKQRIAQRFIEALEMYPTSRKDHYHGERSWDLQRVLAIVEIALTLNPTRKSARQLAYLDEIRRRYAA